MEKTKYCSVCSEIIEIGSLCDAHKKKPRIITRHNMSYAEQVQVQVLEGKAHLLTGPE